MDVLVIAGFLGSGKTTLLLSLAQGLQTTQRIAIIENEVGKIGVDDQVVKAAGWDVRAILSGCICCSLQGDLAMAIADIERSSNPDLLVIEPSGVAGPLEVMAALEGSPATIRRAAIVVLFDAKRFDAILAANPFLLERSLTVADAVVLSKSDLVSPERSAELCRRLSALVPGIPVVAANLNDAKSRSEVLSGVQAALSKDAPRRLHPAADASRTPLAQSVVVAREKTLEISERFPDPVLTVEALRALLPAIAKQLQAQGCQLIGHLKAIVRGSDQARLMASVTDFDQATIFAGSLGEGPWKLTLNVIVFGVKREIAGTIVDTCLEKMVV